MSPTRRLLGALPTALILLAEGAWIAVVYDLFETAAGEPAILGVLAFAALAWVGSVAAAIGPRRLRDRWPIAAVGLVGLVAVLGWAISPATRELLASGDPAAALSAHPGGWLLGLAVFRGISVGRWGRRDSPTGSLLVVGIPAIVGAHLLGTALPEPSRSAFLDAALGDTVVFVAAGLSGLALARVRQLDDATGFDWRRNRAWLGLMLALVITMLAVAVPASSAVGPVVIVILWTLPLPLLLVGLAMGIDWPLLRIVIRTLGLVALVVALVVLFGRLFAGDRRPPGEGGQGSTIPPQATTDQTLVSVGLWLLVVVVLAAVVVVLAALWMRQAPATGDDDVAEERTIDRGTGPGRPSPRFALRRPHRRAAPRDAVEAYLAALVELSAVEPLSRAPDETPREHARRVAATLALDRGSGPERVTQIAVPLGRLALDYELVRFAARRVTTVEDRRAIGRWTSIRSAAGAMRRRSLPGGPGRAGERRS